MRSVLLFLLAAWIGGGVVVPAAESTHAHGDADAARSVRAELGASAAFDLHGGLWAVHKVSGHIAVSRSEDEGRTWQNPVLVTPLPELTDGGGDARPKIAVGPEGEIYVTWTRPLTTPYAGEIRYSRSLDGGRTFAPPAVVHQDRQEITHRFDTLVVNRAGQVFVAWIDKRDLVAANDTTSGYAGAAIYYAVSDNRGTSFHGDYKVADHSCECCRIAAAVRDDGSVEIMWRHIFAPNLRDHAVATLTPAGRAGPVRRGSFEDWRIDACPHHGPSLAIDEHGRSHAVWFSAAPSARGVFYGQLREGTADRLRNVGGTGARHADVAASGRRVAVAWLSSADGRSLLHGMISADEGTTWRETELGSVAGAADHPRLLSHAGRFFVFWNTVEKPLTVIPLN